MAALGHKYAFPAALNWVGLPAMNRPSTPVGGASAMRRQPDARGRQCGGFRPFKRSGLNSRFVPIGDIQTRFIIARRFAKRVPLNSSHV